jgi:hypothetical protein
MLKSFQAYFEKSVWPKIVIWEKGQDPTPVLTATVRNFYDNLKDAINLGYIVKIERISYSSFERDMKMTLSDGSEHLVQLRYVEKYGFTPEISKWREHIGLKKLLDGQENKVLIVDWDYIMCLPGYIQLVEKYDFVDVSKPSDKEKGLLILERKRVDVFKERSFNTETEQYDPYEIKQIEHVYQYKLYTSGKVTLRIKNWYVEEDGPRRFRSKNTVDRTDILQRIMPMNGNLREFNKLFELVLKNEQKLDEQYDKILSEED